MQLIKDYQAARLSKPLALLYSNRIISAIGKNLLALFLPVFFYVRLGMSVDMVILLYIISYAFFYLMSIPGAWSINKFGIRKTLLFSIPTNIIFYGSLYYLESAPIVLALVAVITWGIARGLYWIPYHTSFTEYSSTGKRGRQMSLLIVMRDVILIFIPLASAFLITTFGFNYLFVLVLVVQLLATVPIFFLPHLHEKFEWSVKETYRQLFNPKHRSMMWAYFGDGVQGVVGIVAWPLFIWLLLDESYNSVGIVYALILAASLILRLVIGDYVDKYSQRKTLKAGAWLYSVGWVIKIFVASALHVFLATVYHNLTAIIMRTPFDAGRYDVAADWGHYVDEYTVIRSLAVNAGRVIGLIAIWILLLFFPLNTTFVIAAIGSLMLIMFTRDPVEV